MKKVLIVALTLLGLVPGMQAIDFDKQLQLPDFSEKTVWIVRAGVGFNGVVGSRKDVQQRQWTADDYTGEFKGVTGYDFSFGFNKSFGGGPVFWGMELSLAMRGYGYDASKYVTADNVQMGAYHHVNWQQVYSLKTYTVQLTPITVGYRYSFLERMAAEVHVGGFASYDFAGNNKFDNIKVTNSWSTGVYGKPGSITKDESSYFSGSIGDNEHHHRFDAGMNLGVGVWFGRFNIDFTWQRGFIPMDDMGDDKVEIKQKKGKAESVKLDNLYSNSFQLRVGYAF